MNVEDARRLRERADNDPSLVEYVCRAALLLRDIEAALDGKACPLCNGTIGAGHDWQCELSNALDWFDQLLPVPA